MGEIVVIIRKVSNLGIYSNAILFFCVFLLLQFIACAVVTLTREDVLSKMSQLKPLPKVHYSWKLEDGELLDKGNERLLYEYARISNALSLCGESATPEELEKCINVCSKINRTKPAIPCSIGINYSPWHRKLKKGLPPTTKDSSYAEEIRFFKLRMNTIRQSLKELNRIHKSNIEVSAILLDCERFRIRENDVEWNEAIRQSIDKIHLIALEIFPKARIEWYGRGVSHVDKGSGWAKTEIWTGKERGQSLSCSLYRLPEIERCRETFRRTCKLADELDVLEVTPWIAIASGYKRTIDGSEYLEDWDYDLIYSYQMGRELNHPWFARHPVRFAPYNRAKVVIFYPPPFKTNSPHWGKHFIAYVRGANDIKKLSDISNLEEMD